MKKELNLLKEKCKNLNILYVEDEESVRIQTSKVLSIYFKNIILANNGKDGLEKLRNNQIQIIFTDISMPVMNGLSMIEEIRKTDKFIPIVVLSAYDNTEYFLKTIEYGIDGYILKPFKFDKIHKCIQKVISRLDDSEEIIHIIKLIDNYEWDIGNSTLTRESELVSLTKNEKKLFELLSITKNSTFTSEEIEADLFEDDYNDNKRIRGLISRLNKKVGSHLIKSIYSEGYALSLEQS